MRPLCRERNDGLYTVATYLANKMLEELGLTLLTSIAFCEFHSLATISNGVLSNCVSPRLAQLLDRVGIFLCMLNLLARRPMRCAHSMSPSPALSAPLCCLCARAANLVFWTLSLQGSYFLFFLVYFCSLAIGVGE